MLNIIMVRPDNCVIKVLDWKVGEKSPLDDSNVTIYFVEEVQASDRELMYIMEKTKNLPLIPNVAFHPLKFVSWFGDDAKFIAANVVGK